MRSRRFLRVLAIAAGVLVLAVALLWRFQRRLIYLPYPQSVPPAAAAIPGAEDVAFTTADGLRLSGWFVPARGGRALATVLLFHGNGGTRALRAPLAHALADSRIAVMLFDYRGYAGNPGRPSEEGIQRDARAARAYLAARPDVDSTRIAYYGESLGAAVALGLAVEQPPAALILRSPFTSLPDIARYQYAFLPVRLLLQEHYPSLERIHRVHCPLLVVIGDNDHIVPPEQSRRLFAAANEPKRLLVVPGADHNDPPLLVGKELVNATVQVVKEGAGAR